MQLCIKAHSVAGTPTVVVGQHVAFDRDSKERILVAGRDLAQALSYATVKEQQQRARAEGQADEALGHAHGCVASSVVVLQ